MDNQSTGTAKVFLTFFLALSFTMGASAGGHDESGGGGGGSSPDSGLFNVTSDITNAQVWIGSTEHVVGNPYGFSGPGFGGTVRDGNLDGDFLDAVDTMNLTFTGVLSFSAGGTDVRMTYNLADAVNSINGVEFTSGSVFVEALLDGDTEYTAYDDTAAPFELGNYFLGNQDGHLPSCEAEFNFCTAGIQLATGTNALPGFWNGVITSDTRNSAVGTAVIFGNTAGIYLEGSLSVTPVPAPAAFWLFGSALLGFVGLKRRR